MHLSAKKTSSAVAMRAVSKWYGQFQVLKGIDFDVARGERVVICGPSGSGKSTLIRCINRLEPYQDGQIIVDGIALTDEAKSVDECGAKWAWCSSISISFPT